jgi:hypothetical protein
MSIEVDFIRYSRCATALRITDKAAADVRPTFDVDAIAEITSYAGYTEFSDRLRKLGFQEDIGEGAPLCRWRQKTTTLDVMPLDAKILGFSNPWYEPAMIHSEERELEKDLKTGLVAPVYFCASKLGALAGRGKNDFSASRDLEDLIAVVDGRAELAGGNSSCGERCAFLPREGNQEGALDSRVGRCTSRPSSIRRYQSREGRRNYFATRRDWRAVVFGPLTIIDTG